MQKLIGGIGTPMRPIQQYQRPASSVSKAITSNNELNIAIKELRSSRANALKEKDKLQKVNETQTKIIEHLEREKMTMNLTVESNNSSMINARMI